MEQAFHGALVGIVVEMAHRLNAESLDMVVHGLQTEGNVRMMGVGEDVQRLFTPVFQLCEAVGDRQNTVLDRHFHHVSDMKGQFSAHNFSSQ